MDNLCLSKKLRFEWMFINIKQLYDYVKTKAEVLKKRHWSSAVNRHVYINIYIAVNRLRLSGFYFA